MEQDANKYRWGGSPLGTTVGVVKNGIVREECGSADGGAVRERFRPSLRASIARVTRGGRSDQKKNEVGVATINRFKVCQEIFLGGREWARKKHKKKEKKKRKEWELGHRAA